MAKTMRDLLDALDDLNKQELKRFKSRLNGLPVWGVNEVEEPIELAPRPGFANIPEVRLQRADAGDLSGLLVSYYGPRSAVQVTVEALEAANCAEQAEKLREVAGIGSVSIAQRSIQLGNRRLRAVPPPALHFVDRHREELIQRTATVEGVLDMLYSTVLDDEQYQRIASRGTSQEKMRELYSLMRCWDNSCKDRLYEALKAKNRFLVADLEGRRARSIEEMLLNLNLHSIKKLTLPKVLEISSESLEERTPHSPADLPWHFLRKVLALNVTARDTRLEAQASEDQGRRGKEEESGVHTSKEHFLETFGNVSVNHLDVLCALLLRSDSFLHQEIFLKMSMCQFALPLLLPPIETPKCTLMLWAMRDIIRKWRAPSLAESGDFREESLVLISLPTISFVRMGRCRLSKSKLLNEFLSPSQQRCDFFVHGGMECGTVPREISDGLVEIAWSFPGRQRKPDDFLEPLAVANLHGDVESHWVQFSFLTQVSSAVFMFAESISEKVCGFLSSLKESSTQYYFILDECSRTFMETPDLKGELWGPRRQQSRCELTDGLTKFMNGVKDLKLTEKLYFLKWMKFNLGCIARKNLPECKLIYKTLRAGSQMNAEMDQWKSFFSLGVEHFMRELGQLYEAECSMAKEGKVSETQRTFACFPSIAADLMLEGFPLELVDGGAFNIPLQWITDVLTELNNKLRGRSKMMVITVLGVQSTGKSTLLHSMFGMQFAERGSQCTQGAFMTLLKVAEDMTGELGCDFVLVIDTEDPKAPTLDHSTCPYDWSLQLAILGIGLSDLTLVNLALGNATEIDILWIVIRAFLRLQRPGQKSSCQFVHQNVSDVSARDQNMRDKKHFLEQLDEMTQSVAETENIGKGYKFSDIVDYDPEVHDWYIPCLWHGDPPMAPINREYSEKVFEMKNSLLEFIRNNKEMRKDIPWFTEWIKILWNAVRQRSFSFQNCLMAEAYHQLSMQFSKWDWNFRREMYLWVFEQETAIQNTAPGELDLGILEGELQKKLLFGEEQILESLKQYFDHKASNLHLAAKQREDFVRTAKNLKYELERYSFNKLQDAIKKAQHKIDSFQIGYLKIIEGDELVEECMQKDLPETVRLEVVWNPQRNHQIYTLCFTTAGSFHCSHTNLKFDAKAAVTITYQLDSWCRHRNEFKGEHLMIAGPLFSIHANPVEAVAAVYFPHFLHLKDKDSPQVQIAHFVEGGMSLEKPDRVDPFYAILKNPSFSPCGVVLKKSFFKRKIKVHAVALLYQVLGVSTPKFHLYLLPNDISLRKAVDLFEERCPSLRILKPPETNKPLTIGSSFIVARLDDITVSPRELNFKYLDAEMEQQYLELYAEKPLDLLKLHIKEKVKDELVWEACVRQEELKSLGVHLMKGSCSSRLTNVLSIDVTPGSRDKDLSDSSELHFVERHREQLIQRTTNVEGVLDRLYGILLTEEQYRRIFSKATNPEKMRELYSLMPAWDDSCKDLFYRVLKDKQGFLIGDLENGGPQ
ncbi:hypothetical protein lerEdw1_013158 [Lerista edwardsae]|nr:hypothetical protein lerEdw1_013158 [Lerista edwardsae]